jgi:fatty-acid desaturase
MHRGPTGSDFFLKRKMTSFLLFGTNVLVTAKTYVSNSFITGVSYCVGHHRIVAHRSEGFVTTVASRLDNQS